MDFWARKIHFFGDPPRTAGDGFGLEGDPILTKSSFFALFSRLVQSDQGSLPGLFWGLVGPGRPLGSGVFIEKNKFFHFAVFRCFLIEYGPSNRSASGFHSFSSCLHQLEPKLEKDWKSLKMVKPLWTPLQTPSSLAGDPFWPHFDGDHQKSPKMTFSKTWSSMSPTMKSSLFIIRNIEDHVGTLVLTRIEPKQHKKLNFSSFLVCFQLKPYCPGPPKIPWTAVYVGTWLLVNPLTLECVLTKNLTSRILSSCTRFRALWKVVLSVRSFRHIQGERFFSHELANTVHFPARHPSKLYVWRSCPFPPQRGAIASSGQEVLDGFGLFSLDSFCWKSSTFTQTPLLVDQPLLSLMRAIVEHK